MSATRVIDAMVIHAAEDRQRNPRIMASNRPRSALRRRRRRLVPVMVFIMAAVGLAWLLESRMPTTIIVVRHADLAVGASDARPETGQVPLSERGQVRAELLAEILQSIDVVRGVDVIYASPVPGAAETAEPLASRLGLDINVAGHDDMERFAERLVRNHSGEIVVVVTHGDLIAPMVAELKGHQSVPEIADDEYENIYVVTRPRFGKVKTLRFQYGVGWPDVTRPDAVAGQR
jgi:broad specificity phosphatase PhoE